MTATGSEQQNSRTVRGILGTKLGMTQVFDENNRIVPVTVVAAGPCVVTRIRTPENDGYLAVQLAYGAIDPRKVTKPVAGHFAAAGVTPRRHLVELRTADAADYEVGQELTAEVFAAGAVVDVVGTSKGKGTAGVMKRHHFGGQPASHGTERKHRSPGSLASRATWRGQSGKPKKGVRMAGHMGVDRVTTRNHPLVRVDKDNNLLLIKGALPGPNGGLLFVRKSVTAKVKAEK